MDRVAYAVCAGKVLQVVVKGAADTYMLLPESITCISSVYIYAAAHDFREVTIETDLRQTSVRM